MKVAIIGAGKVGRALFRAIQATRHGVRLVAARRLGRARFDEALLLVAVKDSAIHELAAALAGSGAVGRRTAVVHLAGAYGPELLQPLAGRCAGIGQAHPMLSFASRRVSPDLTGAHLLLGGDRVAVERARRLGRALGMAPREWKKLDRALYHAAGGLVGNGAAALAASGARLLELAGAPRRDVAKVLGPLLRSVGENLEQLGLPDALTGPIRRGDRRTVSAHWQTIGKKAPELSEVYRVLARLQLDLARELGEATASELAAIAREIGSSTRRA